MYSLFTYSLPFFLSLPLCSRCIWQINGEGSQIRLTDYWCCRVPRSPHAFHCTVGDACAQPRNARQTRACGTPTSSGGGGSGGGVAAAVISNPSTNEWRARGGREGDGYDGDGEGDRRGEERGRKRKSEADGRKTACDRGKGGGGVGVAGRLKEEERGRDIVMGHPEEVECQEAISLLSAGVMPLLFHPMLNTC